MYRTKSKGKGGGAPLPARPTLSRDMSKGGGGKIAFFLFGCSPDRNVTVKIGF